MAPRFVARQLARPTGLGGRIIGFLMNQGNARMNAFAVDQLDPGPDDCVLEIGFGGGLNLPRLIGAARRVCGVDPSPDVVDWARKRYSDAVRASSAEFQVGAVEALPVASAAVDRVISVNTVYFWPSLGAGAREIARVLKPGGRVALGFLPGENMRRMNFPADIFTLRDPDDVLGALSGAGLQGVELHSPPGGQAWRVATGEAGSGTLL